MSDLLIRYDQLIQNALRGVVKAVLTDCAREGLKGEHHFYIGFRTDYPGVTAPAHLREKYPQEIVIVLQHKFWDLTVDDDGFSVGLSFGGAPTQLVVPFAALTSFRDPFGQVGFQFEATAPIQTPALVDATAQLSPPDADATPVAASPAYQTDKDGVVRVDFGKKR